VARAAYPALQAAASALIADLLAERDRAARACGALS
jgi:hypothetical protein